MIADSPELVAAAVLRGCLARRGAEAPSSRESKAIEIVASFRLRWDRGSWWVQSQSADCEYRIRNGKCPCRDNELCKHLVAVDLLADLGEELARRIGRAERWDTTVADARSLLGQYTELLRSASAYTPPPDGLLYAFRLESIGDDAWRLKRQLEESGRAYIPPRIRDLWPERPWVAAINGLCSRYEFARGFLRSRVDYREADKRGSRGVYLYYSLPPGLYEVSEKVDYSQSRRYFARVADLAMREITKKELLSWLTARS